MIKERLIEAGFEVMDLGPGTRAGDPEVNRILPEADVLIPGNLFEVNEEVLDRAVNLKLIAKPGTGLDNVDLAGAKKRGIIVTHTPGANAQAVADHTFALILSLARRVSEADRSVRSGQWEKLQGTEVWQKRLGLIGLGAIGRNVARRASGFDMVTCAHAPQWPEEYARQAGIIPMELDDLLKTSDIVSIHCPLTPRTEGMIGEREFGLMKPTAFLINTARGRIVDEEALQQALIDKKIAGAALDAFSQEPPRVSPLFDLPNVILTPHQAWLTVEAVTAMETGIVDQIMDFTAGKRPKFALSPEWPE